MDGRLERRPGAASGHQAGRGRMAPGICVSHLCAALGYRTVDVRRRLTRAARKPSDMQLPRRLPVALCLLAVALLPQVAVAAESASPPQRAYEQVSPIEKNGNQAGVEEQLQPGYAIAAPSGAAIIYEGTGPMASSPEGLSGGNDRFSVSIRGPYGWETRAALPRNVGETGLYDFPSALLPSEALNQVAFAATEPYVKQLPRSASLEEASAAVYRAGRELGAEPEWLSRPAIENPSPAPGKVTASGTNMRIVGGSPNLNVVYFKYYGTLVQGEGERAPYVGEPGDFGLYEWRSTSSGGLDLASAAILPDGTISKWGALPAAMPLDEFAVNLSNEVAGQGRDLFFVSPGAEASVCEKAKEARGVCTTRQLYVRENGERTVLVSRDTLLPESAGQPAVSPEGVYGMSVPSPSIGRAYAYAAQSGSVVYFESVSRLTASAPATSAPKMYAFELASERLTYLPQVMTHDAPVIASPDGETFLYLDTEASPWQLVEWSDGTVTTVATLPGRAGTFLPARASQDGEVFLFTTSAAIKGPHGEAFNNGGAYSEIYRYAVASTPGLAGQLTCVSCAPSGVQAAGDATFTNDAERSLNAPRESSGMSSSGAQVFFQTATPLVSRAINHKVDVYEWSDGVVRLISSGTSPLNSYLLDNSASGEDVFFATAQGLVPQDTDGAYDVYDARMGAAMALSTTSPPCDPAECTAPLSAAPSPALLTAVTGGSGNLSPSTSGGKAPRAAAHIRVERRAVRGARAVVSLRVSTPGTLVANGSGISRVRKRVARAGTATLQVRLTSHLRAALHRGRKRVVIVRLRLRLIPARGHAAHVKVSLRFRGKTRRRRRRRGRGHAARSKRTSGRQRHESGPRTRGMTGMPNAIGRGSR